MSIKRVLLSLLAVLALAGYALAQDGKTMTITAEGLADPNADTYKRDKGLLLDDLRNDAKRQILEKAVGSYVETSTLMQNYALVHDKVLSRSQGFIKRVVKESQPFQGKDGFVHLLMTAEVATGDVKDALGEMGRQERVSLLKDLGNPRVSVAIDIRDAERGEGIRPERSMVAENILKDKIKGFGYRVWTAGQGGADFAVTGEAKFKTVTAKLQASGLEVKKYVLTSWSVKCVDAHTGEEIYYNNKVPQKQSFADEDQAIQEIGQLIGSELSKGLFEEHLSAPAKYYQVQVTGLPGYDAGQLLRKEFIGLRPVLNVDFRDYDRSGVSLFEVEFVGARSNFNQFLQTAVLAPLNQKMGAQAFTLESAHGNVVRVSYAGAGDFAGRMESLPPAGLAAASPERLREVAKSDEAKAKLKELSPQAGSALSGQGPAPVKGLDAVKNF